MMQYLTIILTFLMLDLHGQEYFTCTGVIKDGETSEPLPYASVSVKHRSTATVSNAAGVFVLHVPVTFRKDTLVVSVLGYYPSELPLRELEPKQVVVALTPSPQYLSGVEVRDSLTAQTILKRAYQNLKKNYPMRPYSIRGFYKEVQKADSHYVSLIEASVRLYGEGYQNAKTEQLQVEQLRRSLVYEHPVNSFWNDKNLLWHFLYQNFAKYSNRLLVKNKSAIRKPDTSLGDIPVYVVSVDEKYAFWPTILYIRQDNYAIIRAEEHFVLDRDGEKSWKVNGSPLVTSHPNGKRLQVDFREFEGRYFPATYSLMFNTSYKNALNGSAILTFEIQHYFVVTEIEIDDPAPISPAVLLGEKDNLGNMNLPYEPMFWEHYNIIPDSPQDSAILNDIRRKQRTQE